MKCATVLYVAAMLTITFMARTCVAEHDLAPGPFQPTWESLVENYRVPNGSATRSSASGRTGRRNACRNRATGTRGECTSRAIGSTNTTSRPTATRQIGFMEIDNLWKAERWEPGEADGALQARRARNTSSPSPTTTTTSTPTTRSITPGTRCNVGPEEGHRRHVGQGRARQAACASASATTRPTRGTGSRRPMATTPKGRRPACATTPSTLTKADGKGKWWEGLDPQELYTGRNMVMPDGITSIKARERVARTRTTACGTRTRRR